MGWVGIAAFVASASFLLYRHPPASWPSAPWCQTGAQSRFGQRDLPAEELSDRISATDERRNERAGSGNYPRWADDGSEADVSPDTTPKVTPISPQSAPPIPTFSLDTVSSVVRDRRDENQLVPGPQKAENPFPTSLASPPSPNQQRPPSLAVPNRGPSLMPPPPRLSPNIPLRAPPSIAASLRAPPARAPSTSTLAPPPSVPGKPQTPSRQVVLEPGHSPLDWAALIADPRNNLRGANLPPTLIRVTPAMLKAQNGRKGKDAWTSYRGKVYNITPYIPFHPGGKGEILRGAGKDSEKLFLEFHPWVNWDGMLGECLVGILVSEHDTSSQSAGGWDDMD